MTQTTFSIKTRRSNCALSAAKRGPARGTGFHRLARLRQVETDQKSVLDSLSMPTRTRATLPRVTPIVPTLWPAAFNHPPGCSSRSMTASGVSSTFPGGTAFSTRNAATVCPGESCRTQVLSKAIGQDNCSTQPTIN
jgi:hypothetical protein